MEIENSEYFDLPTLLKQGDLDIRHVAEDKPLLSVDEYFGKLSKFLRLAPNVSGALIKFIDRDGDRDACRCLDGMAALLEGLACNKLILDFHSLLNTYEKKSNWREAAIYAEQLKKDFAEFCSRVTAAKRARKPDILSNIQNTSAQNEISLKEFIKRLDEEEAHRKLLVLAVDDSPVILKSVSSVLNDTYKVFTLPKPTELANVLKKLTPELFLLDYQMPEITGFELVPIIRAFEEHKETPIIFLTSIDTIENVSAALALGACDFIVKPFELDILREKIAKHIVRKKAF